MEILQILDVLQITFMNSKEIYTKNLALQQKFIFILHKKEYIDYSIKYKIYLEALSLLNQPTYKDSHKYLKDYINYFESLF
jgi:hypothetical protein